MKISIVIPNLNSNIIDQTLNSLGAQTAPRTEVEIIVVGQDAPGLVRPSARVKFDRTERVYIPPEARNRGARQATGEVLVFIDADCVAPPGWLNRITAHFADAQVAGVGGGVRFETGNYWNTADNFSWFHEFLDTQPAGPRQQFPSLNLALRRDLFLKFDGFNERLFVGDDFDLTFRMAKAGCDLRFDPQAWVLHRPGRNSPQILWRHAYIYGQYSTKIGPRAHGEPGLPAPLRSRPALLALSPFLALGAALRVYWQTPHSLRFAPAFPAVLLSKLAWCIGAANSPRISRKF
jgi:GT2 family glycosyltransferase